MEERGQGGEATSLGLRMGRLGRGQRPIDFVGLGGRQRGYGGTVGVAIIVNGGLSTETTDLLFIFDQLFSCLGSWGPD